MFGYTVPYLIKSAEVKSDNYRVLMYKNTVEYLKSKFPTRASDSNRKAVRDLKNDILLAAIEIKTLTKKLKQKKKQLKKTCQHPLNKMVHSGYACSTGIKVGWMLSEDVMCQVCKTTHAFYCQEATDEHMNDGF